MRRLLTVLLSFIAFGATAQTTQLLGGPGIKVLNRGDFQADSILYLPRTLVTSRSPIQAGALRYQSSDSALYQWTGTAWRKAGGGDVDTLLLSTRAWRQKGIDSVASVRIGGSGVVGRIPKFTATGTIDSSQIFQSGGRIGIGTVSAPITKLQVEGGGGRILWVTDSLIHVTSANTNITVENHFQNASGVASIDFRTARFGTDGTFGLSRIGGVRSGNGTSDLALSTSASADNPTERMRIFSNGRIGVNTTTDAGFQFDVSGTFRATGLSEIHGMAVGKGLADVNNNTVVGRNALISTNTSSDRLTAFGLQALRNATSSIRSTAIGAEAGLSITTGSNNTYVGHGTGASSTTTSDNTAIGQQALNAYTGSNATAVGRQSLFYLTTGANNTALGWNAGNFTTSDTNRTSSNSIYLGYDARGSANGNTNEVVLGYQGRGNGSNTVTIGNSSTTDNYFFGALRTSAPPGGTANAWRLGTVATVSPTSPNRTIEVSIGGTIYYIHAKTTND